jgi:hypothetical protein
MSSSSKALSRVSAEARLRLKMIRVEIWNLRRTVTLPLLALWLIAAAVGAGLLKSGDVTEYDLYAHAALHSPIFHRFPLEYPAPAIAVFLLPLLLPITYRWALAFFAGVVLSVLALSYRDVDEDVDVETARRFIVYMTLGAVMVLADRYDLFAAACAFLGLRGACRGKWTSAWTWVSVGFLLKLFPGCMWPILFIGEWRASGKLPVRRLLWILGSLILIAGVPALLNEHAALNSLHYYLRRPTEIGSLPAGISLLLDWHAWNYISSFKSINASGPLVAPLTLIFQVCAVLGLVGVWWMQAKERLSIDAACLASITLVVLGTKVFSVQYIMWLIPFWALYRVRVSWLFAALLGTILFPYVVSVTEVGFFPARGLAVSMTLINTTRDLLIAFGTVAWLRSEIRGRTIASTPVLTEARRAQRPNPRPTDLEALGAIPRSSVPQ